MSNKSPIERDIQRQVAERDASSAKRRTEIAQQAAAAAQAATTERARIEALRPVQRELAEAIRSDARTVASLLADNDIHPGTQINQDGRQYHPRRFPFYRLEPIPIAHDDAHAWILKFNETMSERESTAKESSVVTCVFYNEGVAMSAQGTLHGFTDTGHYQSRNNVCGAVSIGKNTLSDDGLVPLNEIDTTLDAEKSQRFLASWRKIFVDLASDLMAESDPN